MTVQRRDYRFKLDADRVRDWHLGGRDVTQFFNGLSVFFPVGERFFIKSVRRYRDAVSQPALQQDVTGFIGQEALHGREHEAFNRMMSEAGLPVQKLERIAQLVLGATQKLTPPAWQLAVTIALEHFTAIYAERLLDDPRFLDRAAPEFKALWQWHALEETEHRAVAFDVWKEVQGSGVSEYVIRTAAMVVTWALFSAIVGINTLALTEADAKLLKSRSRLRRYRQLGRFLLGRGGFLSGSLPALLAYFRPAFHPAHSGRSSHGLFPQPVDGSTMPMAA